MRLDADECRRRMGAARVARLATADERGRPHVVPITFVLDGDRLVFAIDQKPKDTTDLKRMRNIAENPDVAVLADRYDDDWTRLWWVRADGRATIVADGNTRLLRDKYPQYAEDPPGGPVVLIDVERWSGWAYQ